MNALRAVDLLRQDANKMLEIEAKRRRMKPPGRGRPANEAATKLLRDLSCFYERAWEQSPPFLTFDFEDSEHFAGLSVTGGRVIGPLLGGRLQAYLKPSGFVGKDRSANWAIEVGLKLIGF